MFEVFYLLFWKLLYFKLSFYVKNNWDSDNEGESNNFPNVFEIKNI